MSDIKTVFLADMQLYNDKMVKRKKMLISTNDTGN